LTAGVCIIHLIRNTFRFASRKYWDQIAHDLRPVYTAADEAEARARFEEFAEKWGKPYPAIQRLWENAWTEFVPFLDYDVEIRRVICSTNAIWVLYLPAWVGRCFPGQSRKRPALTLNAIDAERLSWIRIVGSAA
jgi:transposase-like protein